MNFAGRHPILVYGSAAVGASVIVLNILALLTVGGAALALGSKASSPAPGPAPSAPPPTGVHGYEGSW
jgi:hypothetical protein